ncbi:GNAT family N-acetyltransferase [Enterococcus sp. HY326]|uniref:GNAT family N-acetyltransferase n=1 Tax=Enterococcus sp. HY326 TaxID=2971265 RepID=UPI00223E95CC|nr:N-acetyltransferase [Enterococcus sp. HY326]
MSLLIRETTEKDFQTIYDVEYRAFNEAAEAELTEKLLKEPTAEALSLLAYEDDLPVGHIVFTKAYIKNFENKISAMVLAPLAIIPSHRGQGIGGELIRAGLKILQKKSVDLVFVLGHIDYYPRHGFQPALAFGLQPPHPIQAGLEDAWMVQALKPLDLNKFAGQVATNIILDQPEYW